MSKNERINKLKGKLTPDQVKKKKDLNAQLKRNKSDKVLTPKQLKRKYELQKKLQKNSKIFMQQKARVKKLKKEFKKQKKMKHQLEKEITWEPTKDKYKKLDKIEEKMVQKKKKINREVKIINQIQEQHKKLRKEHLTFFPKLMKEKEELKVKMAKNGQIIRKNMAAVQKLIAKRDQIDEDIRRVTKAMRENKDDPVRQYHLDKLMKKRDNLTDKAKKEMKMMNKAKEANMKLEAYTSRFDHT